MQFTVMETVLKILMLYAKYNFYILYIHSLCSSTFVHLPCLFLVADEYSFPLKE